MIRTKRIHGLAVIGIGAALALSACGSSSSKASGSSSAAGSAAAGASSGGTAAAGSSVTAKIMVIGDFTSTIPFTVPEIVPTVKGVLKSFPNATIETCDSKGTVGAYVTCEHKAVSDNVAAVIQGFVTAQDQSYLTKAKVPVLDTTSANEANGYPVSESFSLYTALGVGLAKTGCTKLGTIYLDGSGFLIDYIKQGFEASGGKEVARAPVAANAADLAPAVAKLTGAGAQCVAVSDTPTGAAQALTALKQSGKTLTIGGISAIFSQQLIDSLGSLTNGLLVVDSIQNPGDTSPGIQQVAADEHSQDSGAKVTEQAVTAWVSARLVAAALPAVQGAVTPTSMTTALDGLRNVDLDGVIPPWSSIPLTNPIFARIFNHYGINYVVQNGKPVKQGTFYDTSSILQAK